MIKKYNKQAEERNKRKAECKNKQQGNPILIGIKMFSVIA